MRNADQQFFWEKNCIHWRGRVLKGPDGHWCGDWDELPIDALTPEYEACECYKKTLWGRIVNWFFMKYFDWKARTVRSGF